MLALDAGGKPGPVAARDDVDRQLELVSHGRRRLLGATRIGGIKVVDLAVGQRVADKVLAGEPVVLEPNMRTFG